MMDILQAYKFCPICGKPSLQMRGDSSAQCSECGYELFKNPTIGAVAFIFDEQNRLLVVKRSKDPAKGTWHLPGGFVEAGETIEEAVVREIKEELNIDVEPYQYLFNFPDDYIYKGIQLYPLDFFFKCRIKDMSHLNVDLSENSAYRFLPVEEINPADFGLPSIRRAICKYFQK